MPEDDGIREIRDEITDVGDTRYFGAHGAGILSGQLRNITVAKQARRDV